MQNYILFLFYICFVINLEWMLRLNKLNKKIKYSVVFKKSLAWQHVFYCSIPYI